MPKEKPDACGSEPAYERLPLDIEDYLSALKVERNYSDQTIRAYRVSLACYARWCEHARVAVRNPRRRQLRSYLGYLDAAGYARSTINRHLSALRGFFSWLLLANRIDDDPTSTLQGLKKPRRLPAKLSPEEITRLLSVNYLDDVSNPVRKEEAARLRDQAILELFYASGIRVSEAASLSISGLDLTSMRITVFGKGSKERVVPIHELCMSSLRRYLEQGRPALRTDESPAQLVFLSNRGRSMSADIIRRMFKQSLMLAGIDTAYSPHDLRHTFASDMLEGGANLRSVQELLGHASLATTQVYTHLSPSYLQSIHHQAHPRG